MTLALTAFAMVTGVCSASTYTWNGSEDADWTNLNNWNDGLAPTSLTAENYTPDTIIFDGAIAPTMNNATFSSAKGWNADTSTLVFNSGGTFNLDFSTSQASAPISNSGDRTLLTVGDGVGAVGDVTVNISGMALLTRHASATLDYTVNSDGILNFDGNLQTYQQANKMATFTINGGEVNVTGFVNTGVSGLESITFTEDAGSFTAAYGGEFTSFAAVEADVNGLFVLSGEASEFTLTDNGDTFTVSVPEPATMGMLGLGALVLFLRRRLK